jgi:hypothetical protein
VTWWCRYQAAPTITKPSAQAPNVGQLAARALSTTRGGTAVRHLDVQHEERHGDGHDAVAQRVEA